MINKIFIISLFVAAVLASCCIRKKTPVGPPDEEPDPHRFIRGRVLLESQNNHAHCPVVLDSVIIGTITDSTGYYEILIPNGLSDLTGTFQVYYYLYDYDLDSLAVRIENGQVVWGAIDVLEDGFLRTITLQQLLSVHATVDKETYGVDESIRLYVTISNFSGRTIWINSSTMGLLGFYDIHTKETEWKTGQDPTADYVRIDPDCSWQTDEETRRNKTGRGYFIPIYRLVRGYELPISVYSFFLDLEQQYGDAIYPGGPFFVFINDPKNLHFPLVEVVENSKSRRGSASAKADRKP